MRVPHYLTRRMGGYVFRLTVPAHLRVALGRREYTRTLYTTDAREAAQRALVLSARYAWAFEAIEAAAVAESKDLLAHALGVLGARDSDRTRFKIKHGPHGPEVETDGTPEDNAAGERAHARALETWERVERDKKADAARFDSEAYRAAVAAIAAPPPAPAGPTVESLTALYYAEVSGDLSPDTLDARQRATRSALEHPLLAGKVAAAITRTDAAAWLASVRATGVAKSTVQHAGTHLKMVWKWAEAKGTLPHGAGTAIWAGHYTITAKEKSRRKAAGGAWRPFTADELITLFAPALFAETEKEHVRWAMLLGLYTGARVGEVAQIYLRDFVVEDGTRCLKITNESEGQQLKTEASKRLVPLHPDLFRLGLDDLIARRRAAGAARLFDVALHHKAGVGSTISKGFTNYLRARGIASKKVDEAAAKGDGLKGRVGFHSFRKTVIQRLQGEIKLPAERRRAFVGHEGEGGDTHGEDYMRVWTAKELKPLLTGLNWGKWLDFDGLKPLLATGSRPGRTKANRSPYAINRAAERLAEARAKKAKSGLAVEKK